MNGLKIAMCIVAVELGGVIALAGAAGVAAQPDIPANEPEIVVEAPRTLPPPPPSPGTADGRSAFTGAPVIVTTVRISALYGDLDLRKPESAARLMTRIERVARDACATLDRLYPLSSDPQCVGSAVAKAMPTAKALIAAAQQ